MADENTLLSDDRDIRIMEIKAGIKKVIYGTTIGAVALAFFPFAQETAKVAFSYLIEERRSLAEQRVDYRSFLESLKVEARSKNLEDRIVLAEFYATVSPDMQTRELWGNFLDKLMNQREKLRQSEIRAETTRMSKDASDEEKLTADLQAEQLKVSAAAGGRNPIVMESFQDLLIQLDSPDLSTRRAARSAMARMGTGLVRPATAELLAPDLSYRERLGLMVALTEMLRGNKGERANIASAIETASLAQFLKMATDADRTLRIYAGEFLSDLGDPRVFELVPSIWPSVTSDDGRFNLALTMKGAAPYVSGDQAKTAKKILAEHMGEVGLKTDKVLQEALSLIP
ncbi:hypothetical protein [Insolitispirillum peregrinum]|uniref:HEAT repeat-containing protein n=1 Tax=Insolitispirillum peregrinum TaxID=80876 RepID=A0A1N7L357_9PROT|nr:hypothetical protein [Insolitispirillum peregrinum]SIS68227.1 hypothetical protein SAMN05421779_10379 [Insolitispirillum peregrinum]